MEEGGEDEEAGTEGDDFGVGRVEAGDGAGDGEHEGGGDELAGERQGEADEGGAADLGEVTLADGVADAHGGGDGEAEGDHEGDGGDGEGDLVAGDGDIAEAADDEGGGVEQAAFHQKADRHGAAEAEEIEHGGGVGAAAADVPVKVGVAGAPDDIGDEGRELGPDRHCDGEAHAGGAEVEDEEEEGAQGGKDDQAEEAEGEGGAGHREALGETAAADIAGPCGGAVGGGAEEGGGVGGEAVVEADGADQERAADLQDDP